jgi:hypothetical protein
MNKYCPFKAAFEKKKNKILHQGNEGRIASYYSKHRKYQNFAFTFLFLFNCEIRPSLVEISTSLFLTKNPSHVGDLHRRFVTRAIVDSYF